MSVTVELTEEQFEAIKSLAKVSPKAPYRVAELRKHPRQELFAVWSGARWFVFSRNAEGVNSYVDSDDNTWNSVPISRWEAVS